MSRRAASSRGMTLGSILVHLLPAALLSLLFAVVGIVHVTSRVLVVHAGYRLSHLENAGRLLTSENDQLKLELATLKSPARLERLAREKLALTPPRAGSVISLPAGLPAERRSAASERPDGRPTTVRVVNRGAR